MAVSPKLRLSWVIYGVPNQVLFLIDLLLLKWMQILNYVQGRLVVLDALEVVLHLVVRVSEQWKRLEFKDLDVVLLVVTFGWSAHFLAPFKESDSLDWVFLL